MLVPAQLPNKPNDRRVTRAGAARQPSGGGGGGGGMNGDSGVGGGHGEGAARREGAMDGLIPLLPARVKEVGAPTPIRSYFDFHLAAIL